MFDRLTRADLHDLADQLGIHGAQITARISALSDQHDLMVQVTDLPGATEAAAALLASLRVGVAALYEKAEMLHAITLECCRRAAETEAEQMGITDDEH